MIRIDWPYWLKVIVIVFVAPPVGARAGAEVGLGQVEDRQQDEQDGVVMDTPTTTTLCASWATVEAMAPRRRPKPVAKPGPIRPVA